MIGFLVYIYSCVGMGLFSGYPYWANYLRGIYSMMFPVHWIVFVWFKKFSRGRMDMKNKWMVTAFVGIAAIIKTVLWVNHMMSEEVSGSPFWGLLTGVFVWWFAVFTAILWVGTGRLSRMERLLKTAKVETYKDMPDLLTRLEMTSDLGIEIREIRKSERQLAVASRHSEEEGEP